MRLLLSGIACMAAVGAAHASWNVVAPNAYASTAGTGTFLGPFAGARTYQLLIHENQLTNVGVGNQISGMRWRLPVSATAPWPDAPGSIASFDVFMGTSVAPADRTTTFASNAVGALTQVRSGELTIPVGSYATGGNPNDWGLLIGINPFTYMGGHLLIEMRHTGLTGTTTRNLDALTSTTPGYLTDYSALWGSGYTAVTGGQANFIVTQLEVVPEPASMLALALGAGLVARRRRRS
jgi:hypothetical protein